MKTSQEARQAFEQSGTSIASWADARGFSRPLVYAVLAGQKKCVRGESHHIAVALGIKTHARPPK